MAVDNVSKLSEVAALANRGNRALPTRVDGVTPAASAGKVVLERQTPAASPAPVQETDQETVRQSVERLNSLIQSVRRELRFTVDDASGRVIVQIIDADTEQLVRQIPGEEVLALAAHLEKELTGGLMDVHS